MMPAAQDGLPVSTEETAQTRSVVIRWNGDRQRSSARIGGTKAAKTSKGDADIVPLEILRKKLGCV